MELPGCGGRGDLNQPEYLRCLAHEAARGVWNMAVDEALMASARSGRTTLRLYGWEPGCLSFGRNQTVRGRYDGEKAMRYGIDVVRRPTGGRSVLHDREITYSVTAPAHRWGSLRETYALINCALAAGLRELGVEATVTVRDLRRSVPRPTVRACFRDPLPGEVTVRGRKLIGSAQWRERGALLQHGSLLIHNDQAMVEELRIGNPVPPEVPAVGLADLLCPVPSRTELIRVLVDAFGRELSLEVHAGQLTRAEKSAAGRFQRRYEDDAWTWRR